MSALVQVMTMSALVRVMTVITSVCLMITMSALERVIKISAFSLSIYTVSAFPSNYAGSILWKVSNCHLSSLTYLSYDNSNIKLTHIEPKSAKEAVLPCCNGEVNVGA